MDEQIVRLTEPYNYKNSKSTYHAELPHGLTLNYLTKSGEYKVSMPDKGEFTTELAIVSSEEPYEGSLFSFRNCTYKVITVLKQRSPKGNWGGEVWPEEIPFWYKLQVEPINPTTKTEVNNIIHLN